MMAVVAWPPPVPTNTRTNATPLMDLHAADHNAIADALDTLIARQAPLAYVEVTAPLSISGQAFAGSQQFITAPAITYDGGPILIEFYAPQASGPNQTSQSLSIVLADGASTDLGILAVFLNSSSAGLNSGPVLARRRLVPTPGVHTYNVRGFQSSAGTGAFIQAGTGLAGPTMAPASLRITRTT